MNNELYHHGIKGQKWGVRRYQNPDGTLTESGKKRYFKSDGSVTTAGMREAHKVYKSFQKSDRRNSANVDDEYAAKQNALARKAITDVKKHDPNIGANVLMSDGRLYTSLEYENAIKKGLHVKRINWICYGSTLAETLDMIDTSAKYGLDKDFKDNYENYLNRFSESVLKDAGYDVTEAGKELVEAYLRR